MFHEKWYWFPVFFWGVVDPISKKKPRAEVVGVQQMMSLGARLHFCRGVLSHFPVVIRSCVATTAGCTHIKRALLAFSWSAELLMLR